MHEYGIDPIASSFAQTIRDNESDLGLAWDRVVSVLTIAISEPEISKNPTAIEFLEIMRSMASTIDARESIDDVMRLFQPMFQQQMAWDNKVASKSKFDEARETLHKST